MTVIARSLIRLGGQVVRTLERAGDNFAKVRGADLLAGNVPSWLQRILQSTVLPSTLFTRLPLPFAFAFDVTTYAVFDDLLAGGGPVLDFYWELISKGSGRDIQDIVREEWGEQFARLINESISVAPDGTIVIQVPKLWFRDP